MKKYEVMFIVNAANDEVIKAAVKLVQDTITRIGGTVDKVDEWGKRHLAYEVRHQSEGYYVVVDFPRLTRQRSKNLTALSKFMKKLSVTSL